MRPILTCALLVSASAYAAPRVALITTGGAPAAEVARAEAAEVARVEVEALGLEVRALAPTAFPLVGRLAALAAERAALAAALDEARAAFIATRFRDARAIVERAEQKASWRGEPEVARLRGELDVTAALCGDPDGFARAAWGAPGLTLDPARWSPDARAGLERAERERERAPRARLAIAPDPAGVPVFLDGVRVTAAEVEVREGRHFLFALLPASLPADVTVDVRGAAAVALPSTPPDAAERLALMRLRLETGAPPSAGELALASRTLEVEATLVADVSAADWRDRLRAAARAVLATCALRHVPPERAHAQRALRLDVEAGACVARVHGRFRAGKGRLELDTDVDAGGHASLRVPPTLLAPSDRPYVLEYQLWGETARRAATAGVGSDAAPVRVLVESDPIPRWYRKWWVWTLIGVGVAGAVVIPAVVLTRPPPTTDVRLVGAGGGG
jgi:hypothetical protein